MKREPRGKGIPDLRKDAYELDYAAVAAFRSGDRDLGEDFRRRAADAREKAALIERGLLQ